MADLRVTLHRAHEHRERIEARHQDEINWLKQDIDRGRSEIVKAYRKGERVAESLRKQFDRQLAAAMRLVEAREGTIAWLRERNGRMRAAIVRATELIAALREKNARLRAEVRDLKCENAALASRVEKLEVDLDKLRSTRSVLSKAHLRQQERAAEEAGHRAQARPAARRRRTRAHPAPRARAEEGTARPAGGCARMSALRQALCRQRRAVHHPRRDRCRGLREHHRPVALASELRVPLLAAGRDRVAGGAAVRHHALRDQRLGVHALRTLRLQPAAASGRGLAGRYGAGDLAGDPGRQHQALRAAVRTVGRGDPRAPERGGAAPCRRNILARSVVSREGALEPGLAVDLGEPGRGLLPHRSLA